MKNYLLTFIALVVMAAGGTPSYAAIMANITFSDGSATKTAIINQPMHMYLSITQAAGSAATITGFVPTATVTGKTGSKIPAAFSLLNLGPNGGFTIPANSVSGVQVPFDVIFFAPSTGVTGSGTGTYTIGGTLYASDGSVTGAATGARATVNPVLLPLNERL